MEDKMQAEQLQQANTECTEQTKRDKTSGRYLERAMITGFVVLFAIIVLFIGETYAYFVASTSTDSNQIRSGHTDVELIEIREESSGTTEYDPSPVKILPGTAVKQGELVVKNAGSLAIYARIKIETDILYSENEISADLSDLILCNFHVKDPSIPSSADNPWVYQDGYYYYTSVIAPGEKTPALFDTVIFSPDMGNEFMNSQIQFKVTCQSVQATGNSDDPLTAWGWPAESVLAD